MRSVRVVVALATLIGICASPLHALEPPPGWKAKALSAADEKRWIEALKSHVTADGATVLQVIEYAQKLRPARFKLSDFSVLYNSKGEPDTVAVEYWIGAQRLEGDVYADISYDVRRDGDKLLLSNNTKDVYYRFASVYALEQGRLAFLAYIDERYNQTCIDAQTKEKLC